MVLQVPNSTCKIVILHSRISLIVIIILVTFFCFIFQLIELKFCGYKQNKKQVFGRLISSPNGCGMRITPLYFLGKVVLNWLIAQENVVPIPGAKNAEQAKEFAGALGWRLGNEEIDELRSLASKIRPVVSFPVEKL